MKKKSVVLLILIFTCHFAFSQVLVEDLTAIAAAIENGLTMYQQLMNNIQQLQKTAEEVENVRKQMESFDLSKYDWKKWDTFLHAADDFMDLQDDLSSLINSKNMKIGNYNFSLKDLYTTDFYLNCMTEAEKNLNPANISEEQRNAFIGRHGMSPEHYNKYIALEHEISTKSQEVVVVSEKAKKATKGIHDQLGDIGTESESEKSAQDKGNQMAYASVETAIVQTELQISLLESVSNIAQHILDEHKLSAEYLEASNEALANFKSSHNKSDVGEESNYLHLWGKKDSKIKIKVTK